MKKTFTSLLALVGMVAGFTLCSCGGGGGSDDEIVNLDGLEITTLTSSETWMKFTKAATNYYALELDFGGSTSYGHFLVKGFTPGSQPELVGAISLTSKADVQAADNWLGLTSNSNLSFSIPDEIELTLKFGSSKAEGQGTMTRKGIVRIWTGNPLSPSKYIDLETGDIRNVDAAGNVGDVIQGADPEIAVKTDPVSFQYENAASMMRK